MKKRGFGKNKWNGVGGKVEDGETVEEAVVREVKEEIDVNVNIGELKKVGSLEFYFDHKPEWNQKVHIFFVNRWEGKPVETEEMRPKWYDLENIPYEKMWIDDRHWLPLVLEGKTIEGEFRFTDEGSVIESFSVREV